MLTFKRPICFLWDKGNTDKNWLKHRVSNTEAEEVFFDSKHLIFKDKLYSDKENRYLILGRTKQKRALFAVFTLRKEQVRIISIRDLNKKEYKFLNQ